VAEDAIMDLTKDLNTSVLVEARLKLNERQIDLVTDATLRYESISLPIRRVFQSAKEYTLPTKAILEFARLAN